MFENKTSSIDRAHYT